MKKHLMILLFLIFTLQLSAMTLQEAIGYAIKNSPQIEIKKQSKDMAKLDNYISISNFFPSVSSSITYSKLDSVPVMQFNTPTGAMTIPMAVEDNYKAELNLTVPIFMGGKLITGYMISKDKKDIAELDYEKSITDTKMAVIQVYYSLLLMDQMIDMTNTLYESSKEHYETALKRYNAGTISKLELLGAETQYKAILPQLEKLKSQKNNLMNTLKLLIGYNMDNDIELEGGFNEILPGEADSVYLTFTPEKRKDVQILEKNVSIIGKVNNIAKFAFLPNIVGFANLSYKNGPLPTDDTLNLFNEDLYMDESVVWGLSFQLDLFKGGKRVLEKLKTGKQYKQIKMVYANKLNQVNVEVENLINNYKVSSMNIETYKTALITAEEAYRMAKEQYASGIINNSQYLDAENNYIKSKVNYAQGLYQKAIDYYTLLVSTENLDKIKEVK